MINLALNLLALGMSQKALVTCFIIFTVLAVICGVADGVLIAKVVKERKNRQEDQPEEEKFGVEEGEDDEVCAADVTEEAAEEDDVPYDVAEEDAAQDDEDEDDDEGDEDELSGGAIAPVVIAGAAGGKVTIRYNRSLTAKLIQSSPALKSYYSEIKNELLRYGVKDRLSWRHETFRKGRKLLARITVRGKTLYLYLALDPEEFKASKYKIRDVSSVGVNREVPTLYRIKNNRRCRYAKQLIEILMAANGLTARDVPNVDYAANYPYEDMDALIEKNLITYTQYVA